MKRILTTLILFLVTSQGPVYALGLGDIDLNSALNEPFDARIELLSTTAEELEGLKAGLAGIDAFKRAGIDRTFYVALDLAFRKEKRGPDERAFLKLPARIAPYLCAVFPLVKKDGLFEKAKEIFEELNSFELDVFFDEKGSIGKRYARVDEIGVPFAITIDFDSLKDKSVTLRSRDSMEQKRVKIENLPVLLWKLQAGKEKF